MTVLLLKYHHSNRGKHYTASYQHAALTASDKGEKHG